MDRSNGTKENKIKFEQIGYSYSTEGHWDLKYKLLQPMNTQQHKYLPITIDLGVSSTRPIGTYKKFDNIDFIDGLRQSIEDYCNNYKY